ncbi:hypothetical protein PMZ80_003990 [Knufia obscura]|uniref:Uncharacterized protein n=1 Tax=Knufia obscura TaxID=1635080 RepID=A0ABR0RQT4_9EURO|nr:hypothetical protein PMZ80_003990 [Knufia obscura]
MPVSIAALAEEHANVIHNMHQQSNVLEDIHSTLNDSYLNLRSQYEDLRKQCIALEQERTERESLTEKLKRERDSLLAERAKRVAEDEGKIRAAQEAAFAFNAQMTSIAQPDEEIRKKLASIQSQWAGFAKEWASKDITKLYTEGDTHFLKVMTQPYIAASERNANDGLFSKAILPSSGRLLLQAELSHFICWNLISTPFFSFHGILADRKTKTEEMNSSALVLESICQEIINDDPAAGHAWRAQTVGLFGVPRDHQNQTSAQRASAKRREDRYEELVDEFDKGRSSCLYRACSHADYFRRRTSLKNLLHDTGEYLTQLWMQKVHIATLDLPELGHSPFRIGAEEYEPHNRLKLDDEKTDTSLDGWPIQMVVQPAIVACGNEQGADYAKLKKIWTRAIVWVSSGGRSDPVRPPLKPAEQTSVGLHIMNVAQRSQSPQHYDMVTSNSLPIQVPGSDEQAESTMASVKRKPQPTGRRSIDGGSRSSLPQDPNGRPQLNRAPTNPDMGWDPATNGQLMQRSFAGVPQHITRTPMGPTLRGGDNSSKRSKSSQNWFSGKISNSRKQSSALGFS